VSRKRKRQPIPHLEDRSGLLASLPLKGELDPDLPRQAAEKYDLLNVNAGSSGNAGGDA